MRSASPAGGGAVWRRNVRIGERQATTLLVARPRTLCAPGALVASFLLTSPLLYLLYLSPRLIFLDELSDAAKAKAYHARDGEKRPGWKRWRGVWAARV